MGRHGGSGSGYAGDRGSFHIIDGIERETPELGPNAVLKSSLQSAENTAGPRRSSRQGSYPTFHCSNADTVNE